MKVRNALISLFVLGLIFASYFLFSYRVIVETKNEIISLCLDMEEIKFIASVDGLPLERALRRLKESGANAVAIYALTMDGLQREGKLIVFSGYEAERFNWLKGSFNPSFTYVVVKDETLLGPLLRALKAAMGEDRIKLAFLDGRRILEVKKELLSTINIPILFSREELNLLKELGFRVYLRIKNFREVNPSYLRYIFDDMDLLDADKVLIFDGEEVLGYPSFIKEVSIEAKNRNYKMGLVEFGKQIGKEALALDLFPNVLLLHSIDAKEMVFYDWERAISRFLRAVKERSVRVLYVRFFLNLPGSLVEENAKYVAEVIDSVKKAGFKLGDPQPIPNFKRNLFIDFIIALGALSGVTLFLWSLDRRSLYFLPLAFILYALLYAFKDFHLSNMGLALLIAIVFPTWGIYLFMKRLRSSSIGESYLSYVRGFLSFSLYPILLSLSAGIYIASILGEPLFMSKLLQFKGVKIAYLFPLIAVGLLALREEKESISAFLKEPFIKEEFSVFLVLLGIVGIYLLRSGNFPLVKPISVEKEARDMLDTLFYMRPRFKEFLIGYPSMALFLFLSVKGLLSNYRPLVLMVATVASVSIVNSFCHIHTPFLFSLLRTVNGVVLGWLMGAILLLLLYLYKR